VSFNNKRAGRTSNEEIGTLEYSERSIGYVEDRAIGTSYAQWAGAVELNREEWQRVVPMPERGNPALALGVRVGKGWVVRFLSDKCKPKMMQSAGSTNTFYLAPLDDDIEWDDVRDDPSIPLVFVEGPFKGMSLVSNGIYAIAINGVYGFMSDGKIIVDFDDWEWQGRRVILSFDNDIVSKWQVRQALKKLGLHLESLGAEVYVKDIPYDDCKLGPDDYIAKYGVEKYRELAETPLSHPRFHGWEAPQIIHELNDKLAFIMSGHALVLRETEDTDYPGSKDFALFTEHDMHFEYANKLVEWEDQNGKKKLTSKFEIWRRSPFRREVRQIAMLPGKPPGRDPVTTDYNMWQGWGVKPTEPDEHHSWDLMKSHILDVLAAGCEEHAKYICDWAAYCIQHPEKVPETVLVFIGEEGSGKGMFGRALVRLHGRHGVQLTNPEQLAGKFNAHLKDKTLIFADEAFFAGDPQMARNLKGMITEPSVMIEAKFKDAYAIRNYRKLIMATNDPHAVKVGPQARRYVVLQVNESRIDDREYFERLNHELENGGYGAMLWDLLNRDISGFDPRGIPQTPELFEQKKLSFDATTQWWFEELQSGNAWGDRRKEPMEILRGRVHDKVLPFTRGQHEDKALTTKIGMALKRLCPKVKPSRTSPDERGKRYRSYVFPSLKVCRTAFEKYVKQPINWSDGTAEAE
jgi:hypothetical protein